MMEILDNMKIEFNGSWTYSTIFEENNGLLVLASAPKITLRSKHIAIKYDFLPEPIQMGIAHITPIQMEEHLADIFTKGLWQKPNLRLFEKTVNCTVT